MKQLVIIGASGHGKVAADVAKHCGYQNILFLDDSAAAVCGGYRIAGTTAQLEQLEGDFFVAIGNPSVRKQFFEKLEQAQKPLATLVHPAAVIGEQVQIGAGSVVMAGAVIQPCTCIGKGCIINTGASVDHDNVLGDFVHIAVGAHLAGTVKIGDNTWIGIGAVVSNNLHICENCVIGAGAAVVSNIEKAGTYIGVPAKPKQQKIITL